VQHGQLMIQPTARKADRNHHRGGNAGQGFLEIGAVLFGDLVNKGWGNPRQSSLSHGIHIAHDRRNVTSMGLRRHQSAIDGDYGRT
jgi:hypothetical protein